MQEEHGRSPFGLEGEKTTLSDSLSRKPNDSQRLECTNRQISSNCERYTIVLSSRIFSTDRAENGPFRVVVFKSLTKNASS